MTNSTFEAIESTSLPLESIHHIHGGDGLPLGVLSVGDRVPDHILQEDLVMCKSTRACEGRNLTHLKNTSRLLVDQSRDSLDASPSRQPSDGKLGTALDVIPQDLAMPLGSTLAKSFPTLATASHVAGVDVERLLIRKLEVHEIISNIRSCLLSKFSIPDPSETLMH